MPTANTPTQWIIDKALFGGVVCNIGQVDKPTARALDKMVKSGALLKWRGFWSPVAGASHGIGPLKTCWGLASVFGTQEVAS